ncbi:impdh [Symbiodinium sp. CCMP2592]|nr:impdh [Symbiodinium sp. CCMP2592]
MALALDGMDADSLFNTPCLGYALEDLLALPAPASAEAEVKLTTPLSKNVTLNAPLVAAPMDTVTEARMAIACALMGGIGVIHSNCSPAEQAKQVDLVKKWENGFIMDPFVLSQTHTVADVDNIRQKHDASTVCITDMGMMGNRFLGIVTSRDIDFIEDRSTRLSTVMTPKAQCLTASEPISLGEALEKLVQSKKGKLPILNEDGELVALVTRSDLKKVKNFPNAAMDANRQLLVGAAVAPKAAEFERVRCLVEAGMDVLFLEAGRGSIAEQADFIRKVKQQFPSLDVVAGNVVTPKQAQPLLEAGADGLRVGVGSDSLVSQAEAPAIGRPLGSAVYHVARYASEFKVPVVADGGVANIAAAAMALALGASTFMCGLVLAGTSESPGDAFYHDGRRMKLYRGMNSLEVVPAQIEAKKYSRDEENTNIKRLGGGCCCAVVDRGPVKPLVASFLDGVKRDLKRLGASTVMELHEDLYTMKTRFHVRSAAAFGSSRRGGLA